MREALPSFMSCADFFLTHRGCDRKADDVSDRKIIRLRLKLKEAGMPYQSD